MFGSSQSQGASAYAKVGIETGVISASPHKLIVMLYDGAIVALSHTLTHIKAKDFAAKGQSISKAIAIIENGLRASLDKRAGGEIAESLDALYEYMAGRLIQANLDNDTVPVTEVQNLLRDLKLAWEAITPDKTNHSVEAPIAKNDPLEPRQTTLFKA